MTGIGIVGPGGIGRSHLRAWRSIASAPEYSDVRVVATSSRTTPKTIGGLQHHTDWRDLIQMREVDVVDICVPDALHREVVEAALEAGKHVVCEKPLAFGDATDSLLAGFASRKLTTSVCFVYRHMPCVAYARHVIASGVLGRILNFSASYQQQWALESDLGWRAEAGFGGVLTDLGTHLVDLATFLLPAFAQPRVLSPSSEDPLTRATWTMRGADIDGAFHASRVARGHHNDVTFEIFGESASLKFSGERPTEVAIRTGWETRDVQVDEMTNREFLTDWWYQGLQLGWSDWFAHVFTDTIDTIRGGHGSSADFAQAAAVEAATVSAARWN